MCNKRRRHLLIQAFTGAFLLAASTAFAVDTDGDRMPDDWEIANNLNPNDPADGSATADVDGDGLINFNEYRLGTDPQIYTPNGHKKESGGLMGEYYQGTAFDVLRRTPTALTRPSMTASVSTSTATWLSTIGVS